MPWFEIIVQHADGQPASGRRVSNDWNYPSIYTDRDGKAVFEAGRSSVTLYVDGRERGRVRPGRTVVTLR